MEWLSALLGALVGGAATFGGVLFAAHQERKRERARQLALQHVAARAWRDDFYDMQTRLATAVETDRPLDTGGIDVGRLGTTDNFLVLANALLGRKEWSGVAATRRACIAAEMRVAANDQPDVSEMKGPVLAHSAD